MEVPPDKSESESESVYAQASATLPAVASSAPPPAPAPARDFSWWIRALLVCNPFYLASAACLLWGLYLVSEDDNFPGRELAQLGFNFTSLQLYELLLVGTALMLAWRKIWYDSTLLICVENLLISVPFMLLTQAALLGNSIVWILIAVTVFTIALRFSALKKYHRHLNLPRGLLIIGSVMLVANIVLLLVYRHLEDGKVGTGTTEGPAYATNQWTWFLILPAMVALSNLLPKPGNSGGLIPQHRLLPLGLFTLWLGGTVTHFCALRYVYHFVWQLYLLVPPLWTLAWCVHRRHHDFIKAPFAALTQSLLIYPAVVTIIPLMQSNGAMLLIFSLLNLAIYSYLHLHESRGKLTWNLILFSLAMTGAGVLDCSPYARLHVCDAWTWLWLCLMIRVLCWVGFTRNPAYAIVAAFASGVVLSFCLPSSFEPLHLNTQIAFIFLFLHSLRWNDSEHRGAGAVRVITSGLLVGQAATTLLEVYWSTSMTAICAGAAVVLAVSCIVRLRIGQWLKPIVPITAVAILLMRPGMYAIEGSLAIRAGFFAIAGSLLLFGIGTLLALTRTRWNPPGGGTLAARNPGSSNSK